ncbi:adenosine kinase [Saccharothrix saharensis]|uniref:Adenosine kinase n=1 Tax=Saccharothrix saharensis TaxID=571190 RepID=A0A543JAL6_9PSEU|nr:carbohydrate kinase family protein [Saccharothrix saharensis]TQM79873.1 adenosine kinase [Saccharothrix saharensis]
MRIAVTGSIATDHLMVYPGRFTEHFLSDHLDTVSLSFLVDDLEVRRGGVAANISFGLAQLGVSPALVGSVGKDFDDYRAWLIGHGVDTRFVRVSPTRHTSRFLCTTDQDQNQIASFYAGAMQEAREIALAPIADGLGGLDLVVVAPNDPEAMVRHTAEARALGLPFAADPSQQLARMDGESVRSLVDGAKYLFTNEYESVLLRQSTGWSADEVLDRVGTWITTLGAEGVRVERRGHPPLTVAAVAVKEEADPTGVGDAFRAGFLWATWARLGFERACQVGCAIAAAALESVGTQEYKLSRASVADRVARAYGEDAAAEIESRLRI